MFGMSACTAAKGTGRISKLITPVDIPTWFGLTLSPSVVYSGPDVDV